MVCRSPAGQPAIGRREALTLRGGGCEGGGMGDGGMGDGGMGDGGMGGAGVGGPGGGDQAGTGDRARLVFTIRMMKITISAASPAKMSSTPPTMLATRPPPKLSPNARSLPAGRLVRRASRP